MWSRIKLSTEEEQGIDCSNLLSHWHILWSALILWQLLRWLSNKESTYQCRCLKRHRLDPWVGKIPWSRKWRSFHYSCLENSMDRGEWSTTVHACMPNSFGCVWLCDCMGCSPPDSPVHGNSPGKNIEVGCHSGLAKSWTQLNRQKEWIM